MVIIPDPSSVTEEKMLTDARIASTWWPESQQNTWWPNATVTPAATITPPVQQEGGGSGLSMQLGGQTVAGWLRFPFFQSRCEMNLNGLSFPLAKSNSFICPEQILLENKNLFVDVTISLEGLFSKYSS